MRYLSMLEKQKPSMVNPVKNPVVFATPFEDFTDFLNKLLEEAFDVSIDPAKYPIALEKVVALLTRVLTPASDEMRTKCFDFMMTAVLSRMISFDDVELILPKYVSMRLQFQADMFEKLLEVSCYILESLVKLKPDGYHEKSRYVLAKIEYLISLIFDHYEKLIYNSFLHDQSISLLHKLGEKFNSFRISFMTKVICSEDDSNLLIQLRVLDAIFHNCNLRLINVQEILVTSKEEVFPSKLFENKKQYITDLNRTTAEILSLNNNSLKKIFSKSAIEQLNKRKINFLSALLNYQSKEDLHEILKNEFGFSLVFSQNCEYEKQEMHKKLRRLCQSYALSKTPGDMFDIFQIAISVNKRSPEEIAGLFIKQIDENMKRHNLDPNEIDSDYSTQNYDSYHNFLILILYAAYFVIHVLRVCGEEAVKKVIHLCEKVQELQVFVQRLSCSVEDGKFKETVFSLINFDDIKKAIRSMWELKIRFSPLKNELPEQSIQRDDNSAFQDIEEKDIEKTSSSSLLFSSFSGIDVTFDDLMGLFKQVYSTIPSQAVYQKKYLETMSLFDMFFDRLLAGQSDNLHKITLFEEIFKDLTEDIIFFDDSILVLPKYICSRIYFQIHLLDLFLKIGSRLFVFFCQTKNHNQNDYCRRVLAITDWLLRSFMNQYSYLLYGSYSKDLNDMGHIKEEAIDALNRHKEEFLQNEMLIENDALLTTQLKALRGIFANSQIQIFNETDVLISTKAEALDQLSQKQYTEKLEMIKCARKEAISELLSFKNSQDLTDPQKMEYIFSPSARAVLKTKGIDSLSQLFATENIDALIIRTLHYEFGFSLVFSEYYNGIDKELSVVRSKIKSLSHALDESPFARDFYAAAYASDNGNVDKPAALFNIQLNKIFQEIGLPFSKVPLLPYRQLSFKDYSSFQLLILYASYFIVHVLLSDLKNCSENIQKLYATIMKVSQQIVQKCAVEYSPLKGCKEYEACRDEIDRMIKRMIAVYLVALDYDKENKNKQAEIMSHDEPKKHSQKRKGKKGKKDKKGKKGKSKWSKKKNANKPTAQPGLIDTSVTYSRETEKPITENAVPEINQEILKINNLLVKMEKTLDGVNTLLFQNGRIFLYDELLEKKKIYDEAKQQLITIKADQGEIQHEDITANIIVLEKGVDQGHEFIDQFARKNIRALFANLSSSNSVNLSRQLNEIKKNSELLIDKSDVLFKLEQSQENLSVLQVKEEDERLRREEEKRQRLRRQEAASKEKQRQWALTKALKKLQKEQQQREEKARLFRVEQKVEELKHNEEAKKCAEAERLKQAEKQQQLRKAKDKRRKEKRKTQAYKNKLEPALREFFYANPECMGFIRSRGLYLTGGAIPDIDLIKKLDVDQKKRQALWYELISDLDCISPKNCKLADLKQQFPDSQLIPASTVTPEILKLNLGGFKFEIRQAISDNIEDDLKNVDLNIGAVALSISTVKGDTQFELFDPSNGLENILNRKIQFIGDVRESVAQDSARLLRVLRQISKLANYQLMESNGTFQEVLSKPSFLLDEDIVSFLEELSSHGLPKEMSELKIGHRRMMQLLFKIFLDGMASLHFEVENKFNILKAFFKCIELPFDFKLLQNVFDHADKLDGFKDQMKYLDALRDQRQKMCYFTSVLMISMITLDVHKSQCELIKKFIKRASQTILGIIENKAVIDSFEEKRDDIYKNILSYFPENQFWQDTRGCFLREFFQQPSRVPGTFFYETQRTNNNQHVFGARDTTVYFNQH